MGIAWIIAAGGWGVAEATFFFIVPDVLLTLATLRFGWRAGLKLSVVAAAYASLAGIAMWWWGQHDIEAARNAMLQIPAIGPDLLTRAQRETAADWPKHLVLGAVTGVPYKLYAIEAGARHINIAAFTAMSFVARLSRFLLTVAVATAGRLLALRINERVLMYIGWAIAWVCVYALYFLIRAQA